MDDKSNEAPAAEEAGVAAEEEGSLDSSPPQKRIIDILRESAGELSGTFGAFFKAPRALWGINIPYILEGLVYFGILTILGKFCSENVGLNDMVSGWIYGGVTSGITFSMLLFGGVSDRIGIRASLALSLGIMAFGRLLVSLSGTLPLGQGLFSPMFFTMAGGLLCMVTAYGLYQPSAYAGVKRYSNPRIASVSYAVIYGLMNLGAFLSGLISSNMRHTFKLIFPPNGLAAVFWVYVIITVVGVALTLIIITKKVDQDAVEQVARETDALNCEVKKDTGDPTQNDDSGAIRSPEKINNIPLIIYGALGFAFMALLVQTKAAGLKLGFYIDSGFIVYLLKHCPGKLGGLAPISRYASTVALLMPILFFGSLAIWEYLKARPDHPMRNSRFTFFIFILIPVQTLFAHTWLTIPYYLDRAFAGGWASRYFEILSNMNPVLIFILSPIVAGLTSKTGVYRMMILGTCVMALPTFLLALGPNVALFLIYVVMVSVGEAMWQPRFLQWIAEIAPPGKTGAYMGIGQFPWFLTKFITSLYSGYFIARYCPRPGPDVVMNTEAMWLIYALIAIISPITLILARGWMEKGMEECR